MKTASRGFALIEFLIVIAIIGSISTLIASIYYAHLRLFGNQNALIDIANQNKVILDEVVGQIRQSQSIVTTCTPCNGDTTSQTTIVLRLWPQDTNGDPFDPQGTNYDYIVYKRDPTDNTKLIKNTYPAATSSRTSGSRLVATKISSLQFSYDNSDPTQAQQVTITATTSTVSFNKNLDIERSAKAVLRNK